MGIATDLVKAIMCFFNFMFVLAGLGLLVAGVVTYYQINTYESMIDPDFQIAPTLILFLGIIVFIIAFFGCCGVLRKSNCMLVTYAVILVTIFALQLAVGIYAYTKVNEAHGDVRSLVKKTMEKSFSSYSTNKEIQASFNIIQKEFKCCGVNGFQDYILEWKNSSVPASCCIHYDGKPCEMVTVLFGTSYYTKGCVNVITSLVVDKIQIISHIAIVIAVVEILGAVIALCLVSSNRNESRTSPYNKYIHIYK